MEKKKKKEKITYIDDGRTIADMSGVTGGMHFSKKDTYRPHPKFKDVWKTYWAATKMMIAPMLVAVGGIIVIFLVLTLLFGSLY